MKKENGKYKCVICGAEENLSNWIPKMAKVLKKHQMCFDCNHWRQQHELDVTKRGKYGYRLIMDYEKEIDIPFGAFNSELYYQEINIPDGFEATIKDNRIILKRKESEDEYMKNWILDELRLSYKYADGDRDRCEELLKAIAWLEKQGEKKSTVIIPKFKVGDEIKTINEESLTITKIDEKGYWSEDLFICGFGDAAKWELIEQNPTNKVEQKFKVGEWITDGYLHCKISDVLDDRYIVDTKFAKRSSIPFKRENNYHLWTIQDAKDGDVLSGGITIFIFKDLLSDGSVMSYCDYDTNSGESDAFCPLSMNLMCSKITPATKEQRDYLFEKMHGAGYEWNSEKKILKEIEYPLPSFDEAQGTPIIKIDEKKRYVPNEVFRFYVELDFSLPEITVFTKPFPEANSIEEYESREKYVQEKYFTKECINKIKEILIKKIQENDNPFHITCTDRDSGYNVTEDELFKIN